MVAITRVETEPMFGVPQRPRPRNLMLMPPPAPRPVDLDEDEIPAGHDDRGFSKEALANLAHELTHHTAEVNVLARADALPQASETGDEQIIAAALELQQAAIIDLDAVLARSFEEGDRLRDAAMRVKGIYLEQKAKIEAAYQRALAPIVEEMNAHTRQQAQLRRDLERRHARLQTKRPSRKRA